MRRSRVINHYLMGEPDKADDISAWSSDTTRMPYRMHSEYLRTLFLNNDLAEGRFKLNGRRIALQDIRLPVFVVGAERDHVSPWRSVFKIHYLTGAEITFALANGGHNRGIVAPPGESGRYFRISTTGAKDRRPDPHAWAACRLACPAGARKRAGPLGSTPPGGGGSLPMNAIASRERRIRIEGITLPLTLRVNLSWTNFGCGAESAPGWVENLHNKTKASVRERDGSWLDAFSRLEPSGMA